MNATTTIFRSTVFALLGIGTMLGAACSSNGTTGTGGAGGTGGASVAASTSTSTSGSTSGSTSSSGGGGAPATELKFVVQFDVAKGEQPEGTIISPDGATAYVGMAPTGRVVSVSIADGKVTDLANPPLLPAPDANGPKGYTLGLVLDSAGDIYAGVAGFDPSVKIGVYKIPKAGGAGTLYATDANMKFPNGLLFDKTGNLFVADSIAGVIYKVDAAKKVTTWASDPAIAGDTKAPCPSGQPFPLGANGIAIVGTDMYVTNTDKATIVKIPINGDGSAGTPAVLAGPDCNGLKAIDGVFADADGSLVVAAPGQNALVRVSTAGKVTPLIMGDKLDYPASAVPAVTKGQKTIYITNAAFAPVMGKQSPGLLSYGPLP